ncbi:hypothetical protein [Photobacterium sp. 1_MG-2023]|uniref:hypothetical protein n=1 Tax=Photobacterium sp. 1_MG-2023 TaxID=3062646 RepID=UPI0026E3C85F|nr:hypothetical protein [Photobacterium sp. 1_MG-2023]MDO6708659.1 hypothetical protein [Photobacterium sp. 1_MG-2023]
MNSIQILSCQNLIRPVNYLTGLRVFTISVPVGMKIITLILSITLVVVLGNYYLWYLDGQKQLSEAQEHPQDSSDIQLVEDRYSVDKLNNQVSVKQLRKLVLKDEHTTLEDAAKERQDTNDYDLNQLDEEISSLQQYLNKE